MESETYISEITIEELVEINLGLNDSEKKMLVGAQLTKAEKERITKCLRRNKDIFAWSHRDIPEVDPKEVKHYLNIDPFYPPKRQKQKRFSLK